MYLLNNSCLVHKRTPSNIGQRTSLLVQAAAQTSKADATKQSINSFVTLHLQPWYMTAISHPWSKVNPKTHLSKQTSNVVKPVTHPIVLAKIGGPNTRQATKTHKDYERPLMTRELQEDMHIDSQSINPPNQINLNLIIATGWQRHARRHAPNLINSQSIRGLASRKYINLIIATRWQRHAQA